MVFFHENLIENDPEIFELVKEEQEKQQKGIQLIASENYPSKTVCETLSSCLSIHYVDKYPTLNEHTIEAIAQRRSIEAFNLDPEKWGVNVRALSGTTANFAVFGALLKPHDRIMGLKVTDGGHSSHGYTNNNENLAATSIFFETLPYHVNPETGDIDYEKLHDYAKMYRPKLIIAGASCFSKLINYKRFREICDEINAVLMADIAHISGFIAGGSIPSPFEYVDILNTTTHKSLRGPKGALIFFRKHFEEKINQMVYPGFYGGAHNHVMAAIAVAMKEVKSEEFKNYAHQAITNSKTICKSLIDKGYKIFGGITENHVFLVDLRPLGISGQKAEWLLSEISIYVTKITCPGENESSKNPSGIRIGTPAITARKATEIEMEKIASFLDECLQLGLEIDQISSDHSDFNSFKKAADLFRGNIGKLKEQVELLANSLTIPGFYKF